MIALAYGGRDWDDQPRLSEFMDAANLCYGITELINGDARGADRLAVDWAASRGIPVRVFPAQWYRDGRYAAGPIRNQRMLVEGRPDIGIEFKGENGTKDMRRRLLDVGVPVIYESGNHSRIGYAHKVPGKIVELFG